MTTNTSNNQLTGFVTNILEQEDRRCRLEWQHGPDCPGIEIHGFRLSPEESDFEECDALACDSLEADVWIRVGGTSSGSLCSEHLVTWLEHEVDINCDGCGTMFKGIEEPE